MSDRKDRVRRKADDEAFAERCRELFNESVEELDAATLSRLNRSRNAAVDSARGKRSGLRWTTWVPATGVAAAAAVAVVVITGNDPGLAPVQPAPAADLELLLEGDDLEMLEDLEFYSWIDLEPETASNVG